MGIEIGGINLTEAIVNIDYQLMRTQKILEWVVNNNELLSAPDEETMVKINKEVTNTLKKRYPRAGLKHVKSG